MKRHQVCRTRQGFTLPELILVLIVLQVLILLLGSTLAGSASGALLLEGTIFLAMFIAVVSLVIPAVTTFFYMRLVERGLSSRNYGFKALGGTGLLVLGSGFVTLAYAGLLLTARSMYLPPPELGIVLLALIGMMVGVMEATPGSKPVPVRCPKQ